MVAAAQLSWLEPSERVRRNASCRRQTQAVGDQSLNNDGQLLCSAAAIDTGRSGVDEKKTERQKESGPNRQRKGVISTAAHLTSEHGKMFLLFVYGRRRGRVGATSVNNLKSATMTFGSPWAVLGPSEGRRHSTARPPE